MYQRRGGGKARTDARRLNAEFITGVAVSSGNNAGKRQPSDDTAPPTSDALQQPMAMQMRRPSGLDSYNTAESAEEQKEQTKKQLESITGRMFQVLNDFEDDEQNYAQNATVERRRHSSQTHRQQMMSNIDGMMADYDQISAEREELLESLADWFQQGHIDPGEHPFPDWSHPPATSHSPRVRTAFGDRMTTDTLPQDLQKEVAEGTGDSDVPQDNMDSSNDTAVRDAVTMSWKYAAMEIYGLLSDVRDTDAEEMNALEQRIMELLASLTQQSKFIDKLSAELQHQKELVRFSDKTMRGMANDNSDLREQLDKVRGQLVEARKATKSSPGRNDDPTGAEEEEMKEKGGETNKNTKNIYYSSGEEGVEVHKAQIKDLEKLITQLQEENKKLKHSKQSPAATMEGNEEKVIVTTSNSAAVVENTPSHHEDNIPSPLSAHSDESQQVSETEAREEAPENDIASVNNDKELKALREQLKCALQEKRALEEECRQRRQGVNSSEKGRGKKEKVKIQNRSQHTQTPSTRSKKSPTHQVTSSLTPNTSTTQHKPSNTRASTANPANVTMTTKPVNNNTMTSANSTVTSLTTSLSKVTVDPSVTMETVTMDTTAVPNITVEHTAPDTVTMTTTTEAKMKPLDMVEDIINKVIINQSDLMFADTNALQRIHGDLQQLCDVILSYLVDSSRSEERGNNGDVITAITEGVVRGQQGPSNHAQPVPSSALGGTSKTLSSDGGRRERNETRPQTTRDEIKMYIGHTIQDIHNEETSAALPASYHHDRLQKLFEVLHSHRQQEEEMGTVAYQLPAHFLTRDGIHMTDLHRPHPREGTDQLPHLERSVSVRGVANKHHTHDDMHHMHSKDSSIHHIHATQMNTMLYPWGHPFQTHGSHPHHPPLQPSLLSPHTAFPIANIGGLGITRGGGGAVEGKRGGGREGKKGRRKKQTRHSQVVRSNFLHVGNTFSTPPRTAPPAGLRGVANSLGNHYHGDQTTVHNVKNPSSVAPNNDSGTTFIDLLLQAPKGNSHHGNKTNNAEGGGTIKLPRIK